MFKSLKSKLALAGAAVATALPCFAQDPSSGSAFDTALNEIKSGMTGTIDKIVPVIAAVVVAAIAMWAIPFAWRKLRGGAGR